MAEELSKDQSKLIGSLIETGVKKNVAKTLVVLAGEEGIKSRTIEDLTDLRQPEISLATQRLRELGWITKTDQKKEGKGRPVHLYSLDKAMEEIVNEIEEKEKEKIDEIKENVEKIKELADSL